MTIEEQPKVLPPSVSHFSAEKAPWRSMGQYLYRIIEDGSRLDNRLSAVESLIPPKSSGPVMHYHEMHDECFLVMKGVVRFHSPGIPDIDAKVGDFVTVPLRAPHKFSNPFDEDASFINLNTPGFYVRYFELLEEMVGKGNKLTPEVNRAAMMRFATIPMSEEDIATLEKLILE